MAGLVRRHGSARAVATGRLGSDDQLRPRPGVQRNRVVRRAKPRVLRAEHECGRGDARPAVGADRRGGRRRRAGRTAVQVRRPEAPGRPGPTISVAGRLTAPGMWPGDRVDAAPSRRGSAARRGRRAAPRSGPAASRGGRVEHRHGTGSDRRRRPAVGRDGSAATGRPAATQAAHPPSSTRTRSRDPAHRSSHQALAATAPFAAVVDHDSRIGAHPGAPQRDLQLRRIGQRVPPAAPGRAASSRVQVDEHRAGDVRVGVGRARPGGPPRRPAHVEDSTGAPAATACAREQFGATSTGAGIGRSAAGARPRSSSPATRCRVSRERRVDRRVASECQEGDCAA